ncbi:MAG: pyruvate kinase [Fimbriimonadaceae bacterium]|nr:pyruvate kinase [Chitinophagales bacterium]
MKKGNNKTKIIATLGPASANPAMIEKLLFAGVDVFRLNFSHGTHEQHAQTFQYIKEANKKLGRHVSILADLQGPKIRLGEVIPLTVLLENDILEFTTEPCIGTNKKVYITYHDFPQDVHAGETILIDDGRIELKVLETNKKDTVITKVIFGGPISSKKGVNLPDTKVSIPSLTEKDHADLLFALEHKANWIALSFVRKADDIIHLKNIIRHHGSHAKVIAKIEKPEALKNIDAIIDATDAVMVARGDLGVEMPVENVPFTQKDLCRRCLIKTTPVIIATQMMESMIESPHPTRAEVTDVANAVLDGADAVMLSAETATGKYPEMVIKTMVRIIEKAEKEEIVFNRIHTADENSKTYLSDAICFNACNIAKQVNAAAIMGMTKTGYTAFMVASCRPKAKIYIFTNNEEVVNILNLLWGVEAFFYEGMKGTNNTFKEVQDYLAKEDLLKSGDIVINLGTMPVKDMARTNTLKISVIQ